MCICACLTAALTSSIAEAGTIERACLSSSRGAAQTRLCHCIGQVAEQRLTRSEQRTVASWFEDPHRAQEARQSVRNRDEALWRKYQVFGTDAERICG
ncbi:hypothetical protein FGE21_00970 [Phaeobacter sp. B1627]|nr:hypothetical protein FGE21_00970 [Phaeobacter sp. B1627]